jgi:hypothetical protein
MQLYPTSPRPLDPAAQCEPANRYRVHRSGPCLGLCGPRNGRRCGSFVVGRTYWQDGCAPVRRRNTGRSACARATEGYPVLPDSIDLPTGPYPALRVAVGP